AGPAAQVADETGRHRRLDATQRPPCRLDLPFLLAHGHLVDGVVVRGAHVVGRRRVLDELVAASAAAHHQAQCLPEAVGAGTERLRVDTELGAGARSPEAGAVVMPAADGAADPDGDARHAPTAARLRSSTIARAASAPPRTASFMPRSWGYTWAVVDTYRPGTDDRSGGMPARYPSVTSGAAYGVRNGWTDSTSAGSSEKRSTSAATHRSASAGTSAVANASSAVK